MPGGNHVEDESRHLAIGRNVVRLRDRVFFRVSSVGWAVLSGAVTSGLGYVVWYAAVRAAIVQLSVPVLAGLGGVAFLGEIITRRVVVSGGLILGGIAMAVWSRQRAKG